MQPWKYVGVVCFPNLDNRQALKKAIAVNDEDELKVLLKIVKPWSKSESKPLSKQAPKSNKSPPKKKKEGFGPWADTKITWATTTTTTTTTHP